MAAQFFTIFTLFAVVLSLLKLDPADANPAIATGYDSIEVCIENCAQCKKMLGAWFEGPLCAEYCIKIKGKLVIDCEDLTSIAPFIKKL